MLEVDVWVCGIHSMEWMCYGVWSECVMDVWCIECSTLSVQWMYRLCTTEWMYGTCYGCIAIQLNLSEMCAGGMATTKCIQNDSERLHQSHSNVPRQSSDSSMEIVDMQLVCAPDCQSSKASEAFRGQQSSTTMSIQTSTATSTKASNIHSRSKIKNEDKEFSDFRSLSLNLAN